MIKKFGFISLITLFSFVYPAKADFSFREKFVELSQNGGNLDKVDLKYLKTLSTNKGISDPEFARETVKNLEKYKKRIRLEYTIYDPESHSERILYFNLIPTYSESEKITGKNIVEVISNISQRDNLAETLGDGDRCAAASMLNSYLLMGGKFPVLAKKLGIDQTLTYKNIHLVQEKIYNYGNTDKSPGIYAGFKYSYYDSGSIFNIRPSGEIVNLGDSIGIKVTPILGKDIKNIHKRKVQVNDFLARNPRSTIQTGVYLNTETGNLSRPVNEDHQNHVITIFKSGKTMYYSDTSNIDNGTMDNVKKITQKQLDEWLYDTPGVVMGLTMK